MFNFFIFGFFLGFNVYNLLIAYSLSVLIVFIFIYFFDKKNKDVFLKKN